MLDDKTKMFLIKAMTEGIECNFQNEEAKDYFIHTLQKTVDKNEKIGSKLIGDSYGLLMEDSTGDPYGIVKLSDNLVLFALLIPEPDLTSEQSVDFGRIVLAVLSTFALIEAEQSLGKTGRSAAKSESVKFNISEIGVII
tara:strand:- start:19264 stop:19683 length:420 start_codon:yes stop_codon:yes gene_type:complete